AGRRGRRGPCALRRGRSDDRGSRLTTRSPGHRRHARRARDAQPHRAHLRGAGRPRGSLYRCRHRRVARRPRPRHPTQPRRSRAPRRRASSGSSARRCRTADRRRVRHAGGVRARPHRRPVTPSVRTDDFRAALEELRAAGLYREMRLIEGAQGARVVLNGREVIQLCSNDYLGLASHPTVRGAAAQAAERWGAGVGASRLVSGNTALDWELEQQLAEFKGYEACVLIGSGYLANTGVIPALAGRGGVILSDALNHASIVDGCRQSRAETIVYEHCDLDSLANGLRRAYGRPALIVTDALFSMDGDLAPLQGIVELAGHHGARVLVDEAHATGVIGPGGRGLVAELGIEREVDVVIGTLSKALGSYGAFACGSR